MITRAASFAPPAIVDLLRRAVDAGASDLHILVDLPPMVRVSGLLRPIGETRLTADETAGLAYGMFDDYHRTRFEQTWDLDFSYTVGDVGRFRVNVHKQRGSIGLVARVIPDRVPSIEDLNLPLILKDLTRKPRGLVLVTGPTGHGKSTTLAALIGFLSQDRLAHIVTIEDPIEYIFLHSQSIIRQREVGHDTQSFANALRSVLREDPDVIVIGEMRDLETIAAALTIAETGHLVFATLHTANAAQSMDRIIDVFPPYQQQQIRAQLSGVVEAVLSQQLLPVDADVPLADRTHAADAAGIGSFLYATHRVPAIEVMVATPAIRNLIREGKAHQIPSAVQTGAHYGMQTMDQALFLLYKRGLISAEAALARAIHPADLRTTIERSHHGPAVPSRALAA